MREPEGAFEAMGFGVTLMALTVAMAVSFRCGVNTRKDVPPVVLDESAATQAAIEHAEHKCDAALKRADMLRAALLDLKQSVRGLDRWSWQQAMAPASGPVCEVEQ